MPALKGILRVGRDVLIIVLITVALGVNLTIDFAASRFRRIRHRNHYRVSAETRRAFSHREAARCSIIPTTAATPAAPTD